MLTIIRVQPTGSAINTFLDASVSLRDGFDNVPGCPDVIFSMETYQKIAKSNEDHVGDQILLPINLFFETLTFKEHKEIYEMFRAARQIMSTINYDNRSEMQDLLQEKLFNTIRRLDLSAKMIKFCQTAPFIYPDLSEVGTLPHHTPGKTYVLQDYVEITAISLLSKMMVPIWGEFIKILSILDISNNQRERLAFDLIEPTLEEGVFERIYQKLSYTLITLIKDRRSIIDKKGVASQVTSSFIITHNGVDDQMFNAIVMATIVVKRMATYECFTRLKDGNVPNAMVYIDDGIRRTADTRISGMRKEMKTMPHWDLPTHDTEDNSSILDHTSRTSKKPIDDPIFVVTAVEHWELPKFIKDIDVPMDVFNKATEYYISNSFDVSPLCQAMVASFVGNRFGGSKCIQYLTPKLHQQIVILLQVFLIRNEMYDLASLISSKSSTLPIDGPGNPVGIRLQSSYKTTSEYLQCHTLLKGYLEKPVINLGKKSTKRKEEFDRIDFSRHIEKMVEWLIRYTHTENTAPVLWNMVKQETHPIVGAEVKFDENVIRNLCRFYLTFHGGQRPF